MSELKTNLQSILQEKNTKIIPQNIKKDVEVLDVTGSYDKEDIKELEAELADAQNELATVRRDLDNSTATISGSGEIVTLNGTAEARFKKPPLPMGNSEQVQYSGKNKLNINQERIDRSSVSQILNNTLNIVTNDSSSAYSGTDYLDISVVANQTYILSFDWNSNITLSGTDARVYIYSGSQVGTLLDYINLTGTGGTISKTFTSTTDSISIRFSPNNTGESKSVTMNFSDIMISTNGGDYEPYVRTELQAHHQTIHKK